MTPIGSRWALMRRRRRLSTTRRRLAPAERPNRPRDREHLLVVQRPQEGVGHPIGPASRAPGHELQTAAVVEQLVGPPARAHAATGIVEDRRRAPIGPLDAVVLPDPALVGDDPIGAVALAGAIDDVVGARVVDPVAARRR